MSGTGSAAGGSAGLRQLPSVLIAWLLPGMSGPELADPLRERDGRIAVLFATGYTQRALNLAESSAGLIEKPFSLDTFLARVSEVLAETRRT